MFQKNIPAAVSRDVQRAGELGGSETTQQDRRDSVREGGVGEGSELRQMREEGYMNRKV